MTSIRPPIQRQALTMDDAFCLCLNFQRIKFPTTNSRCFPGCSLKLPRLTVTYQEIEQRV